MAITPSGRSAALIEENYGAPSVQALNKATVGYLRDGGYLSPRGLMIIADRHEEEAFHSDLAHMGVEQITPDDALRLVPILAAERIAFAGYHADAHDIDTDRLLQDFAKELRGNGGRIETGHPVTSITRTGNTWKVTAGPHIYHAAKLVNAAGAWADQIAILAGVPPISITPYRRSMARIAAPGRHDLSRWPMFFGVGETWYAKPDAGALLVSPADEDATEPQDAWADDMVLAEGLERYQNMVAVPLTKPIANMGWAAQLCRGPHVGAGPRSRPARLYLERGTRRLRFPDQRRRLATGGRSDPWQRPLAARSGGRGTAPR